MKIALLKDSAGKPSTTVTLGAVSLVTALSVWGYSVVTTGVGPDISFIIAAVLGGNVARDFVGGNRNTDFEYSDE